MISRKLIAALVGVSLATGLYGAASAQTAQATAPTAPVTTKATPVPAVATPVGKAKAGHATRMHKATHRKHLSNGSAAGHSTKQAAKPSTKRVHLARNAKHAAKHG